MHKGALILTFSQGEKELPRTISPTVGRLLLPLLFSPLGEKDAERQVRASLARLNQ